MQVPSPRGVAVCWFPRESMFALLVTCIAVSPSCVARNPCLCLVLDMLSRMLMSAADNKTRTDAYKLRKASWALKVVVEEKKKEKKKKKQGVCCECVRVCVCVNLTCESFPAPGTW